MAERLHRNTIDAIAQCLQMIFDEKRYADNVIEKVLKQNPRWGARDRRFIAETTYNMVRNWRLILNIAPIELDDEELYYKTISAWLIFHHKEIEIPNWLSFENINSETLTENYMEVKSVRVIKESIPDWLDELCEKELGEKWSTELKSLNEKASVILRANTLKTSVQDLKEKLNQFGVESENIKGAKDALKLKERSNVFQLPIFKEGLFEVQDASSQRVGSFLNPKPGERVIDACAGAGGKSLHLAALMESKGRIISLDTEQWKLDELKKRARRAGAGNIETRVIDSTKVIKRLYDSADCLLLDVPCSGLGVLRRNPDAKWKLDISFIEKVKAQQQQILSSYYKMLKLNGTLVYATCSILPSENSEQVKTFMNNHEGIFELEEEQIILPSSGYDGFYMARLKRKK